jgi:hypothetical protein
MTPIAAVFLYERGMNEMFQIAREDSLNRSCAFESVKTWLWWWSLLVMLEAVAELS